MSFSIKVRNLPYDSILSHEEIVDLVSLFFEKDQGTIIVFGKMHPEKSDKRTRGLHVMEMPGLHEIYLNFDLIKDSWKRKEAVG